MNCAAGFLLLARNKKSEERGGGERGHGVKVLPPRHRAHRVLGIGSDGDVGTSNFEKLRELCVWVVNCRPQCPLIPSRPPYQQV